MFGPIGGPEFLLLVALALLLFGPRKLPELGKSLGRALAEFRGAANQFKSSLEREVELEQVREVGTGLSAVARDTRQALSDPAPAGGGRSTAPPAGAQAAAAGGVGGDVDSGGEGKRHS